MKRVKNEKKLTIKKSTVVNLDNGQMAEVKGGGTIEDLITALSLTVVCA